LRRNDVMTYPLVPGPRMAYDRNGSGAFYHDGTNPPVKVDQANLVTLNDEADISDLAIPITGSGWALAYGFYLAVMFPQLRDFVAWGGRFGTQGTYVMQTSKDSTNGQNGTWTNISTAISNIAFDPSTPLNRTTYQTASAPGVGAVRFFVTGLNPANAIAYGI